MEGEGVELQERPSLVSSLSAQAGVSSNEINFDNFYDLDLRLFDRKNRVLKSTLS